MGRRRRTRAGAAGHAPSTEKGPATGNPRPLILLGSVLAGTVLVTGAGTLHSEAAGADDAAPARTAQIGTSTSADVVTDVEPLGEGPHGACLWRLQTAAGEQAYVIADAEGTVRSVRVVASSSA